jgi:hypothetical protein
MASFIDMDEYDDACTYIVTVGSLTLDSECDYCGMVGHRLHKIEI